MFVERIALFGVVAERVKLQDAKAPAGTVDGPRLVAEAEITLAADAILVMAQAPAFIATQIRPALAIFEHGLPSAVRLALVESKTHRGRRHAHAQIARRQRVAVFAFGERRGRVRKTRIAVARPAFPRHVAVGGHHPAARDRETRLRHHAHAHARGRQHRHAQRVAVFEFEACLVCRCGCRNDPLE